MNPDLTNSTSQVNDPCSLGSARYKYLAAITQQHPDTLVSTVTHEGTSTSFAPHPYVSAAPPLVTAAPRPYVSAAPRPYVTAAARHSYVSVAPPPIVSTAPHPYVSAAPYTNVSAPPPPYINAAPLPYVSAALAFTSAPQVPLDYSKAAATSQAQSTVANKNSMSSSAESNQPSSSRKQALAVRPDFTFADSYEGGRKLQNVNVSWTTSNDSHQFTPVISKMQTLRPDDFSTNSISVSGTKVVSTQESQMCIGSVFSLADSHSEHQTDQHETENEAGHVAIDSYASRQTRLEHPVLPVHQQNETVSAEQEHDTVSFPIHTALSTKQNQYSAFCSALNSPVCLSPLGSSSNNIHETKKLLHKMTTSKNSVSVEVSSLKDDSQLLLACGASIPTSAARQRSTSAVTSIKDVHLPVSEKNGSLITETEKKSTDVLRVEEKPTSLTKPQDSSSTSQMLPFTSKVQEPEIVDLDLEDIDDCMLVKVDLSRHHFPYGSKIHNSEVVIDDSDNDEDVLTKETGSSCGETSSGKCDEQNSSASSTVVVGGNDPCGTTGSLSMEVEEINTKASKTNSEQTSENLISQTENPESELMDLHVDDDDDDECDDAPPTTVEYVSLKVLTPSQPDKNVSTPVIQSMDLQVDDDDDEFDDAEPTTGEYASLEVLTPSQPDKNVSTPVIQSMDLQVDDDECDDAPPTTVEYASLKVLTSSQPDKNVSTPVIQSMDLQVDDDECDDAPPTTVEYASLKVLTSSQPDKNVSTPVIQSMDMQVDDDDDDEWDDAPPTTVEYASLKVLTPSQPDKNISTPVIQSMFSSSSLLSSTSDIPVLKENYCNPCLEPAVQGQVIENTMRPSEVPFSYSPEDVRKGQVSQVIDSSKVAPTVPRHESHHLQLNSVTETLTNSNHSRKASPKATAIKSTTPRPKGKSIKSTTPRPKEKSAKSLTLKIKIPSAARIQKKSQSNSGINSKAVESTLTSTETDSSLMCRLCFMVFSSRIELVTHTWCCHRSSQFVENNLKCDECGKGFAYKSLLKLHKKVKCTSSNMNDVDPGTVTVSLDSILHTLVKQNSATVDISNSTHVDVSRVLNSFPERNEVVSNYSTGVVTEAATGKHPVFATGDKPMSEELMQEDIKPVITSTGEILQRSDGPDQVLAGGHPSVIDSHKCTTCQMMFLNSFQLSLHQQFSEGCKVARNDCVRCFVCSKSFTSNIIRYLHVLNNPECKEKIDRYCIRCSHLFNNLADKQAHIHMFNACRIYEECIIKDVVKDSLAKNMGHVEQNVKEPGNQLPPVLTACEISQPDKSPALAQENNNSTQLTDSSAPNSVLCQVSLPKSGTLKQHSQINPVSKSHTEKPKGGEAMKQKPCVKAKPSGACPACKKKFATGAMLILHFNESPKCRMKICSPSKVAKKISASEVAKKISASEGAKKTSASEVAKKISPSDRINVLKPGATLKSPGRASMGNVIKSSSTAVTASRNVFCDISSADRLLTCKVCGGEFISNNELTRHTEQKCRKLYDTKAVPQLKNLRIILSRVSVMCQVCHLPFADDARLAKHLHLNQPCQKWTSERVRRVLELKKSHLDIDTLKRDGKKRSCEIVTGISNVTSNISMASTLAEQVPAMDNVINEKMVEGNDGHISSNSKKQSVCDQGNANDESKGDVDDNDNDELISSLSSSDEGSNMEESGSSSEEENRDYACKQCCKIYDSKSQLLKHNKSHHHSAHSKRTHCKVCTRKFHDLTGLQAHLLQFKFCFIPLTRPLWERKQDPQICSMCKKVLGSPKDLRKHCFKKMACRLRYVNLMLKNVKEKDHASVLPAAEAGKPVLKTTKEKENTKVVSAAEAEIPVLKTAKEKDNTKLVPAAEAVVPAAEAEKPVLKTAKEKDNAKLVPAAEAIVPAAEAVLPVSKTGKENCESQSANEVSSSVQDYCNPVEVDSSNSDMDIEDGTSCIKISHVVSKPLVECLNCRGYFDDFQEHLLKQQSCLDFFGIHTNKCPVPLPFCYQCKTHFDDIGLLQLHACKGFVAYTQVCQTCGLKFTSAHKLHAHFQQSLTCNETNLSSTQKTNHDSGRTFVDSSAKNQQSGMLASSSAARDMPTSSGEQFFHCLICVARFATLRLLMEHSYQHVEETPISCDRCGITFLHYNQFVSHQAFHIRMDKEANMLVERPQPATFGASTSTYKNVKAHVGSTYTDKDTRVQNSETMTNIGSACIFCHQEFGSWKTKLTHLNSDRACLAMMKYSIENNLFVCEKAGTGPFDRRVTNLNHCEFCNQSVPYKFYHFLTSACFWRLESAILKYRSSPHPHQPRVPYQ